MVTLCKFKVEGEIHEGMRRAAFVEFVMLYLIWVVVIQERLLRSCVFLYALKT